MTDSNEEQRSLVADLRGATRLAIEATVGVTDVVEAMHRTIASGPPLLGAPFAPLARALTAPVYATVRGVTGVVGAGIDRALAELAPLLADTAGPDAGPVLAAVNGVLGDYLAATDNPLAIPMRLRPAPIPATGRVLVLVHGSCMSDRQWSRRGHDHGAALARDLGYAPVYVHYNSGLHVSTNGRTLARLLEELVAGWPVPLTELSFVTHSMGGLVTRAAAHVAEVEGLRWRGHARAMVFLGTPHHGSPLERHGNLFESLLGVSAYSSALTRLGQIRSAGVTDLRYGNVLDAHWDGRDRFARGADPREAVALPEGVACFAVAGAVERLGGDGLVPVESALGRHTRPELSLAFPADHLYVSPGANHLDLLCRDDIYARIRGWLGGPGAGDDRGAER